MTSELVPARVEYDCKVLTEGEPSERRLGCNTTSKQEVVVRQGATGEPAASTPGSMMHSRVSRKRPVRFRILPGTHCMKSLNATRLLYFVKLANTPVMIGSPSPYDWLELNESLLSRKSSAERFHCRSPRTRCAGPASHIPMLRSGAISGQAESLGGREMVGGNSAAGFNAVKQTAGGMKGGRDPS